MKLNKLLFALLILLPVPAFAHGLEVLVSFFYELITLIALIIFIALIKWESSGKTLLGIILIVSVVSISAIIGRWPYTANRRLIEILGSGVPLFSVLATYFAFRKRFTKKMRDNTDNLDDL
jgi:hypothetical protein